METDPSIQKDIDDYSDELFDINDELQVLINVKRSAQISEEEYDTELGSFADRTTRVFYEAIENYPEDSLEIEANLIADTLGDSGEDFAVKFNEILYSKVSGVVPIDAINNRELLQRILDLTQISDIFTQTPYYGKPSRATELRDAVIGRVFLTAISFNVDPSVFKVGRYTDVS